MEKYSYLLIALLVSFLLGIVISLIGYIFSSEIIHFNFEKLRAYECGFNPFEDARSKFEVQFYIVAILFIILDIELCFLFPFAISIPVVNAIGYFLLSIFLFLLTLLFCYEWKKGAIEWS